MKNERLEKRRAAIACVLDTCKWRLSNLTPCELTPKQKRALVALREDRLINAIEGSRCDLWALQYAVQRWEREINPVIEEPDGF